MDPISLSMLVGLITQSAAEEAGRNAWEAFTGLVRRAFGREQHAEAALEKAEEGDQDSTLDLAGRLVQSAATDPEIAELLRAWMAEAQQATPQGSVANTISGQARVSGGAVQGRDFGSVRLSSGSADGEV